MNSPLATRHSPLLSMSGISKSFGATQALCDVSLDVPAGRVLALIGENGAGKSTLMKVLSGAHAPDAGTMMLNGNRFGPNGPHDARLAGVGMIYQELNLAPDLSVEDNIMLGQERSRFGLLNRATQRAKVREALDLLGHPDLKPSTPVRELPIAQQQLVEIARALASDCKVIVFDEPTSSLTRSDVEHLFAVIRRLKSAGLGVVYISHFLEEIRQVCDCYAVLRDGRSVGSGELADATNADIVSLMVGRSVAELFPSVPHTPGEVVLSVSDLSGVSLPCDVSFELRRGEILGIAGLIGAGRTELLRCLFGLDEVVRGRFEAVTRPSGSGPVSHDRPLPNGRGTDRRFGLVSEDRKTEGLAQSRSIADNLTYSRLKPYSRFGWLNLKRRRAAVVDWMRRLQVKAASPEQTVGELSGGNQQKVAIARVLHQEADILLLDEPTRGIDVGTKAEIYRLMGEQAAAGKAILFVSSYLTELLAVCDRVAVMSRGRLKEIRPAQDWTEEAVMAVAVSVNETVA
ncbi:MAG: ribose transport system ATP-binding protein [Planctomycetota bacterium]|nr:MAG: ribose transport system ATP-binding protein [Planctomycetota bacterium]